MSSRKYTDAQKAAYWKRQAQARVRAASPRTNTVVRGYGAYRTGKKPTAKRASGSSSAFSPPDSIGGTIGGWLGHGAQKIIKAITGFGDYNIEGNSILAGGMSPPQIVNSVTSGAVILRHREFIANVHATTAFTNTTFDINPGLAGSFPWLSQVAKAFEMYRLRGLVYEFKSMSSDSILSNSSSSALGTVVMATQYNSLNAGFTNEIQMENHEFANACKPSCDFYHPVECKKSLIPTAELYVRDGAVPTGGDIRLYDIGQFNVATLGMQNAGSGDVIGQLWCTYEVELYQMAQTSINTILTDHIKSSSCTGAAPLGTSHAFATGSSLGLSINTTQIAFPNSIRQGKFLILLRYNRASAAFVAPTLSAPGSGTFVLEQFWSDGVNFDANATGNSGDVTSTTFHLAYIISVVGPNYPITLTWGTAGTISSSLCDMWVTQIDADITD